MAELRKDKGLKQADLAVILGTTGKNISKYETGETTPPDETKIAIAEYFDVSLDYLMELTDEEVTFRKTTDRLRLPRDFPDELIGAVQNHIDILYDSYRFHKQKK